VLVTGGSDGRVRLASADLYDPTGIDLSQSTVAVAPARIASGTYATVTLTAKDTHGTPLSASGLTFSFCLGARDGSGSFSNLRDGNNGTYTATFTGKKAGPVAITATLGAQIIRSTLPIITVTPDGVDPSLSTVAVSSTKIGLGGTLIVTLTAKDG